MGNSNEKTILSTLDTYWELYTYLAKGKRPASAVKTHLEKSGRSKTNARSHTNAAKDGTLKHVSCEDDVLALNYEGMAQELQGLCNALNFDAQITPKKKKPEDDISSVTSGKSPSFRKMKDDLDTANATKKQLEEMLHEKQAEIENLEKLVDQEKCIAVSNEIGKKVVVPKSVESDPIEVLAKDFFSEIPRAHMDVTPEVSKSREDTEAESMYADNAKPNKALTEENFIIRFCRQFTDAFFGKLNEIQDKIPVKQSTPVNPDRQQAIEILLSDEEMGNQTKIATYAAWYFKGDPEMEELLLFAGDNGINANYLIRLLEKPAEYQNYRTIRAFLKQAQSASEAHLKREAVQELLCGDWQAVAEYCGKQCHFKLVPVEELSLFKNYLLEYDAASAAQIAEEMLTFTFGPMDQKSDDKAEEKNDIEAPDFIHQEDADVDVHAPVDDSAVMDDFADKEVSDGE